MPETTFTDPDLTTFLGLDALELTAVGQHLTAKRAVIECRMPIGFEDPFCKACGAQGQARGTVARRLSHVPVGWRPTQLVVRVRRFTCTHCRRMWRQDTSTLAELRARLTHSAVEWGLRALALERMSVSRVPAALGELLAHRQQRSSDPSRADHHRQPSPLRRRGGPRRRRFPRVLRSRAGGTPCVWRHTKQGDKHVRVRRAQEQPQRPRPEHRRRACAVDRLAQAHNLTLRDFSCYYLLWWLTSWLDWLKRQRSLKSQPPPCLATHLF